MNPRKSKFTSLLTRFRRTKKMTQSGLAGACGISTSYMNDIELERRSLYNESIIYEICDVLQLTKQERHEFLQSIVLKKFPKIGKEILDV